MIPTFRAWSCSWLTAAAVSLLGSAILVASPAHAQATDSADAAESEAEDRPLIVGLRGVAEVWQDPFIIQHYRSSRFMGAFMTHVPIGRWLGVEAELGYSRTPSESARPLVSPGQLEYLPITLSMVAVKPGPRAELFGGVGYAMAVFTERTDAGTVSGAKPGLDLRGGARIHTRLIKEQLRPTGTSGAQGLDIELLLGRRQHQAFGIGTGFDFSAWRLGAGMVVRL